MYHEKEIEKTYVSGKLVQKIEEGVNKMVKNDVERAKNLVDLGKMWPEDDLQATNYFVDKINKKWEAQNIQEDQDLSLSGDHFSSGGE